MRIKPPHGIGIRFRIGAYVESGISWITDEQSNLVTRWGLNQLDQMWVCDATTNALLGTGTAPNRRDIMAMLAPEPTGNGNTIAISATAFTNDDVDNNRVISFGDGTYATIVGRFDDAAYVPDTAVLVEAPIGVAHAENVVAEVLYVEQSTLDMPTFASTSADMSPTTNSSVSDYDETTQLLRIEDTRALIFEPLAADITFHEIGWAPVLDNGINSNVFGRRVVDAAFLAGERPYVQVTLVREIDCSEQQHASLPIQNYDGTGTTQLLLNQFDQSYRSYIGPLGNTIAPYAQNAMLEIAGAMSRGFVCYGASSIEPTEIGLLTDPLNNPIGIIALSHTVFIVVCRSSFEMYRIMETVEGPWEIEYLDSFEFASLEFETMPYRSKDHLILPIGEDLHVFNVMPSGTGFAITALGVHDDNSYGQIVSVHGMTDEVALYVTGTHVVSCNFTALNQVGAPILPSAAFADFSPANILDSTKLDDSHLAVSLSDGTIKVLRINYHVDRYADNIATWINIAGTDPCTSLVSFYHNGLLDTTNNVWYNLMLDTQLYTIYGGVPGAALGDARQSGTTIFYPQALTMMRTDDKYLVPVESVVKFASGMGDWNIELRYYDNGTWEVAANAQLRRSGFMRSNPRLNRGRRLSSTTNLSTIDSVAMSHTGSHMFVHLSTGGAMVYPGDFISSPTTHGADVVGIDYLASAGIESAYAIRLWDGISMSGGVRLYNTDSATAYNEENLASHRAVKVVGTMDENHAILWYRSSDGKYTLVIYFEGASHTYFTGADYGDICVVDVPGGQELMVANNTEITRTTFETPGTFEILIPTIPHPQITSHMERFVILSNNTVYVYDTSSGDPEIVTIESVEDATAAWIVGDVLTVRYPQHIEEYSIYTGKAVPLGVLTNMDNVLTAPAFGDYRMLLYDNDAVMGLFTMDDLNGVSSDSVLIDVRADKLRDIRRIELIGSTYLVSNDPFWRLTLDTPIPSEDAIITNFKVETKWGRA